MYIILIIISIVGINLTSLSLFTILNLDLSYLIYNNYQNLYIFIYKYIFHHFSLYSIFIFFFLFLHI